MYYMIGGSFEPTGILSPAFHYVVNIPLGTVALTWVALATELLLAITVFTPQKWRSAMFIIGLAFHCGIFILLGISSFQLVMIGGLFILATISSSPLMDSRYTITMFSLNSRYPWTGLKSDHTHIKTAPRR